MLRYFCIALFILPLASARAADDAPAKIKPTPWHLVDIWWNTGQDRPFESYAIDVTISDEVPSNVNLYIAPIGLGHLSKTPFYGGIQTQTDGYTKQNRRLRKIGPGLLMSMWGERSLDAIRPSVGGLCQSSGHEGDFISVRRPYKWKKGKFTYRIVRMDKQVVKKKPYTWVGAFLYSHQKEENVFIGALRFPGENLVLAKQLAGFVEIYGQAIPLEQIPKLSVTFGNLRVNGQAIKKPAAIAIYPKGVPDYANAIASQGQVIVQVGQKVEDRKQRRIKLLPANDGE